MAEPLRVAHVSDTHIGYKAYRALTPSGDNQRGTDIVRAFATAIEDIVAWDPPLVIHSGDVGDRPTLTTRQLLMVGDALRRLAGVRPDGTRRQVVVIAGNHDAPPQKREACYLELFANIEGVHIVTRGVSTISFEGDDVPEVLNDVSVVAVPHDTLRDLAHDNEFHTVAPTDAKWNILTAHGVAGGSELFRRSLGREYPIPTEVLARDWDYIALGHYHKSGPVALSATGGRNEPTNSRAWYAGSSENMGFGDLNLEQPQRGWLAVTLGDELPQVERRAVPNRLMVKLASYDGSGADPEQIRDDLIAALVACDARGELRGAIVNQVVTGVTRDTWGLVDTVAVRAAADGALHYDMTLKAEVRADDDEQTPAAAAGLGDIDRLIVEAAEDIDVKWRDDAVALARNLIEQYHDLSAESEDDPSPATSEDAPAVGGEGPGTAGVAEDPEVSGDAVPGVGAQGAEAA